MTAQDNGIWLKGRYGWTFSNGRMTLTITEAGAPREGTTYEEYREAVATQEERDRRKFMGLEI